MNWRLFGSLGNLLLEKRSRVHYCCQKSLKVLAATDTSLAFLFFAQREKLSRYTSLMTFGSCSTAHMVDQKNENVIRLIVTVCKELLYASIHWIWLFFYMYLLGLCFVCLMLTFITEFFFSAALNLSSKFHYYFQDAPLHVGIIASSCIVCCIAITICFI